MHDYLKSVWDERIVVKKDPASGDVEAFANEFGVVIKFDDGEEGRREQGKKEAREGGRTEEECPGASVIRAMKEFALRSHTQRIEPHVTVVQGMYAGKERENLTLQISHLRSLLACIPLSERTISFSKLVPHRPGGNLFLDVEGATCAFLQEQERGAGAGAVAGAGGAAAESGVEKKSSIPPASTKHTLVEWKRKFSTFTQFSSEARKCAGLVDLLTEFLCRSAPPSGPLMRDVSKILHEDKPPTCEFQPGGMWRFGNVVTEQTRANRAHITALYGNTQPEVVEEANRRFQEAVAAAGLEGGRYRAQVQPEMIQLWTIDAKGNLGERVAEHLEPGGGL